MSDHFSGPAVIGDPSVDITDFYAFESPERPGNLVLIMNVFPLATSQSFFSTHVDERGLATNVTDASLHRIETATKIWAAGVQGSPLGGLLTAGADADLDRAGRVKVDDDCTLPGHPEVFVIGDLMSLRGLPGVSQVAIQSGRHAADTIRRRLKGDTARRPFRYRDFGSMATIARFRALAAIGPVRLTGFFAWVLWLFMHLAALTGFKHRLSVFFNWTVGLLGGGRAERVITLQQVFGRHAMAARAAETRPAARGA